MTSTASVSGSIGKRTVSWLDGSHPLWLVVAIALPGLILIGSVIVPNQDGSSTGLALAALAALSVLSLGWAIRAALVHRRSMPRLSATLWAALVGIAFWILSATLDDLRAHELFATPELATTSGATTPSVPTAPDRAASSRRRRCANDSSTTPPSPRAALVDATNLRPTGCRSS